MKSVVSIILLLLVPPLLFAHQDTIILPAVQVFPTHNYPLRSIDSTVYKDFVTASVDEAIQYQAPVFIKNYGVGQISSLSFRGTGARHTKIFWEDVPLNSPMLGELDVSLLPNFFFNDIDFQLGGNDLENGSGAIGAQLNLQTKNEPSGVQVFQEISSLLNSKSVVQLNYNQNRFSGSTKGFYHFGANRFHYKNKLQQGQPKTAANHSDFKQTGILQSVNYQINQKNSLTAKFWYQYSNRDLEFPTANQKDNYQRTLLEWKRTDSKTSTSLKAAWLREQFLYLDTLESHATKVFAKAKFGISLPHSIFLQTGIDVNADRAEADGYRAGVTQNQISGFAELTGETWQKFHWIVALREVWLDQELSPLLYSIQLSYKPLGDLLFFRVNHSRNYNFPTINSRFWQPGGNPSLEPEESLGAEISILTKYKKPGRWQYGAELNFYRNYIDNWIQWAPANGQAYWEAKNLKKVVNQGIEINSRFDFFIKKSVIGLTGIYTFSSAINKSITNGSKNLIGKQLIYTPKFQWKSILSFRHKSWGVYYHQQYAHIRFTTSDNQSELPGYYMSSLSANYDFFMRKSKLVTKFRIDNIFNFDYEVVAGRPMPLRSFVLGIGLTF